MRRLDAEFIRDNALAVSGLLNRRMYGPSVQAIPAGRILQGTQLPEARV